jgi:hypothetical protein
VRISSDHGSIPKGSTATISVNLGAASSPPCNNVTVYFTVKTAAQNGVDYTLTDAMGQDATTMGHTNFFPLTLTNLYTSRKKTLPVQIVLQKNRAYYLGNTKVTVQILAK